MTTSIPRHSERRQECFVRKMENGIVAQSEESVTLVTSYRFPHHGNRSFAAAQDDVLWSSLPWAQTLHIRFGWRLAFPSLWRFFLQSSFWTEVRIPCEKAEKRDGDTEWRIYYTDDILSSSSLQQQILRWCTGWRLTVSRLYPAGMQ